MYIPLSFDNFIHPHRHQPNLDWECFHHHRKLPCVLPSQISNSALLNHTVVEGKRNNQEYWSYLKCWRPIHHLHWFFKKYCINIWLFLTTWGSFPPLKSYSWGECRIHLIGLWLQPYPRWATVFPLWSLGVILPHDGFRRAEPLAWQLKEAIKPAAFLIWFNLGSHPGHILPIFTLRRDHKGLPGTRGAIDSISW